MDKKEESLKRIQLLEKIIAIVGAIAAVGLLVLYLFFTQEETGKDGPLYPVFISFLTCILVNAILAAIIPYYKKRLQKKDKN